MRFLFLWMTCLSSLVLFGCDGGEGPRASQASTQPVPGRLSLEIDGQVWESVAALRDDSMTLNSRDLFLTLMGTLRKAGAPETASVSLVIQKEGLSVGTFRLAPSQETGVSGQGPAAWIKVVGSHALPTMESRSGQVVFERLETTIEGHKHYGILSVAGSWEGRFQTEGGEQVTLRGEFSYRAPR